MEQNNPEKAFLLSILSLANDREHQQAFLMQLGTRDFEDPLYCEIFKGFCHIVMSGQPVNLATVAEHFKGNVDFETLKRICVEMEIYTSVDYSPDVAAEVQLQIENLKMAALDRKFNGDCPNE